MSIERRGRIRYEVRYSALVIASRGIQKGQTENLSGTGACICCPHRLKPKEDFFLEIEFPTGGPAFQVPAQVVWTSDVGPDGEAKPPRMGLRFTWEPRNGQTD